MASSATAAALAPAQFATLICCSALPCVAVCAVYCGVLEWGCGVLQCVAVCCSVLQCVVVWHLRGCVGACAIREVGGWGQNPKKCTGRGWGMGSSTI